MENLITVIFKGLFNEETQRSVELTFAQVMEHPELCGQVIVSRDQYLRSGLSEQQVMERIASKTKLSLVPSQSRSSFTRDFAVFNVPRFKGEVMDLGL